MIKKIFLFIIAFLLTLTFNNCTSNKVNSDNKAFYNIKIGETFEFYFSEKSCCKNCWLNKTSLTSIKLIEEKVIKQRPEDCDGCGNELAYVFKGVTPGIDTIKFFEIGPLDKCVISSLDSFKLKSKFSIVTVTK